MKQIDELVKELYPKRDTEIVNELKKQGFNLSTEAVRKRRQRLGLTSGTPQIKTIEEELVQDRKEIVFRDTALKYKKLKEAFRELEDRNADILQLSKSVETTVIKERKSERSEATAFLLASDWHVEEKVTLQQTNGMNEYTLEGAKLRSEAFFRNSYRLIQIAQKDTVVSHTVLCLLGDFFSGNIHEDTIESAQLSPVEATIFAQNLLASGIQFLLSKKEVQNLKVVCSVGNHGRITKVPRVANEVGNSLEFFMYHTLKNQFPQVEFVINEGYHTYIDVYDFTVRLHHGHAVGFGGGIGGVTIPLNKKIAQWNKERRADYEIVGHFHTFLDTGNAVMNGSLIGYNAYAKKIGASYDQPKQGFFLIDKHRGKSLVAPVWVTESAR